MIRAFGLCNYWYNVKLDDNGVVSLSSLSISECLGACRLVFLVRFVLAICSAPW